MTTALRSLIRRISPLALVPLLALVALVSWSLASPPGASPDDDFHLASSWCGLGERADLCEGTDNPGTRMIPQEISTISACYAFKPEVSAGCLPEYSNGGPLVEAVRGNFQGLYPPVYYAVSGLFASTDIAGSALVMRIVNSVIFVALASALFLLLPLRRRAAFAFTWLVTTIPLGIFIIASNNPSGWAVLSAGTLWLGLVGYFETVGKRRIGLGVIAALAVVLGAGARADSAVYCVLGIGVAIVLSFERSRRFLISLWLPLVLVIMSIAFYFSASQGGQASAGISSASNGTNPLTLLANNIVNLPLLWAGAFGSGALGALGWFDTPMPGIVAVGSLSAFAVVAFAGLGFLNRRKFVALAVVALALVAVPLYVLYQTKAAVGTEVQPRYILPMIVILAGVALFEIDARVLHFSRVQLWLVLGALIAAHALALHFTLRRFITGLDVGNPNLNANAEWWWGGPVSPMVVWAVGTIAFGLIVVLLARVVNRRLPANAPLAID